MQIWDTALVEKGSALPVTGTGRQRSVRRALTSMLVAHHSLEEGGED
jgi:hypothetical protein